MSEQEIEEASHAVLVEKAGPKSMRFLGVRGNRLDISFSTDKEISINSDEVSKFCRSISSLDASSDFTRYLLKLMERLLNQSHGTILICCPDESIQAIGDMRDVVALQSPIDLAELFAEYEKGKSAKAILSLQQAEALIAGMMQSDGIVAFDGRARVIAYRAFFLPAKASDASDAGNAGPPVGGARLRAFTALSALVGGPLRSALFRSQDGQTIFAGA
jgi:hypothetical protein